MVGDKKTKKLLLQDRVLAVALSDIILLLLVEYLCIILVTLGPVDPQNAPNLQIRLFFQPDLVFYNPWTPYFSFILTEAWK